MNKLENLTVYRWMISDLKLSGNELLTFAFIYSYSTDGMSVYMGGQTYLSDFLGISRQSVNHAISKLLDKNLIKEFNVVTERGKFKNYAYNFDFIKTEIIVETALEGCQESLQGGLSRNLTRGCQESLHKDIYSNIDSNNSLTIVSNKEIKKEKNIFRKFAHLSITEQEVLDLKKLGYSEDQINITLDDIENYRKNTQYKSLKLTLKKWLVKNFPNVKPILEQTELNLTQDEYNRDNFFNF